MKIIKKFLLMLLSITSLYSCGNKVNYDYSIYYSYKGNLKGIEVYCWDDNNGWNSGILPGTNRVKTIDEVKWLQDNLPCPLSRMKEILNEYKTEGIGLICIVDVPPSALNYDVTEDNKDDYIYVCDQLGISFPSGQMVSSYK